MKETLPPHVPTDAVAATLYRQAEGKVCLLLKNASYALTSHEVAKRLDYTIATSEYILQRLLDQGLVSEAPAETLSRFSLNEGEFLRAIS